MRIARLSGVPNLSELVKELYEISGPQAARVAREAEAALVRANPHLREPGARPGPAIVVVPDVPGARPRPAANAEPTALPGRALVDDARAAVGQLQKRLEEAGRRAAEDGKQTAELLQSREVKALAEKVPAVRDALVAVGEATKARLAELEALKAFQDQAIPDLLRDLEALGKRLG
jgi:hypothetical protein